MDVPAIRDKPNPHGFGWVWEAYIELSTCRTIGMAPGPIPWTALRLYAKDLGLTADEAYFMTGVVRHLDRLWLRKIQEKSEMTAKKGKSHTRTPTSRPAARGHR